MEIQSPDEPLLVKDGKTPESRFDNLDMHGTVFHNLNLSGSSFEDINLSGARFFNINLRNAQIGAIDFGGSVLSCMNTGEDRPKLPVSFKDIELDGCTFTECAFTNVKLENCGLEGMRIDGIPVAEMLAAYREQRARETAD